MATIDPTRRQFLRGLGGAAVAAPLLSSVVERAARAQSVPVGTPRRLFVMFTHFGCVTTRWFPESSHGPLQASDLMGTTLEPLAPHAGKLLLPRGIRAMNQWTANLSLGQGNDQHTQVAGSYFTCAPVTPNSDDPFSFDEETKFLAMPTAASLDHVCARHLHAGGTPFLLHVSGTPDPTQHRISYSAAETPFDGVASLDAALGSLTGLFGTGAMDPDTYQVVRGKSIIDVVRGDLDTLQRLDMSQADRQKLEAWAALLDDTTSAVRSLQCNEETATSLELTEASFALETPEGGDVLTTPVTEALDRADLYSNIAVLSALCDHSRVTLLKYPGAYVFRGLDLDLDSHMLSHRIPNAADRGCEAIPMLLQIEGYYAAKFAHLVAQLDGFEEGDGTLLDHSAAVWFQEMSDGNAHNLNNMPLLQAGSCGEYFATGRIVNVWDGTADLHRGNSEAHCYEPELPPSETTGTPANLANAPINKYYCTLMNALGVKGDANGFPDVSGSGEVSQFGTYDRTEDFAGGGEVPPNITDPGELSALRG